MTAPRRPRAVLLVANTAAPYSRANRVGASLVEAGYDVEIAAVAGGGAPATGHEGEILVRRYEPSGIWRRWASMPPPPKPPTQIARNMVRRADKALKAWLWPLHVRAWWRTLRRELPPADVYHAFGILTVGIALDLAHAARAQGRAGVVVYDVIDAILDSNNYANVPAPILNRYRRIEAGWVRRVDAVVTVNDRIADHCAAIWPFRERATVLLNCQPRWEPPLTRPQLIREAAGIPPDRRIVLYLGRLGKDRGLDAAAEAVMRMDDAVLVLLGFGINAEWSRMLRERASDPRYAGRHIHLPAVHPDEVRAWASSADVSIVAPPAASLNQRLSSPNKFWESLAAGTPVVVGEELEVMRAIVERDNLGATADAEDPDDLARALSEVLALPREEYEAMRERCLRVCRDEYNWETAVVAYLALVEARVTGR